MRNVAKNVAYVFQHKFTGAQIFIYHQPNLDLAMREVTNVVSYSIDWIYLGQKIATDI